MTPELTALRVPAGYRNDWALFTDWCDAYHLPSCPADPVTVARFLDFEAADLHANTLRRRVTAINAVHRRAGHRPPGTATAVRRLLSRRDRHVQAAQQVIRQLPTTGWPGGLFGRRDALLLHVVCVVGLPIGSIADLRCGEVTLIGDTVHIGGTHRLELHADRTDPYGLLALWARWAQVQQLMARRPSPRSWITPLNQAATIDPNDAEPTALPPTPQHPEGALLPAFDRWGTPQSLPGTPDVGLSVRAVYNILTTHLVGAGRPTSTVNTPRPAAASPLENDAVIESPPVLADVYAAGIAARRHALERFVDIDDAFDEIDRRTHDILARTANLLDELDLT